MSNEFIKGELIKVIHLLSGVPEMSEMNKKANAVMRAIRALIHVLFVIYNDYPTTDSKLDCIEDMRDDVDEMLTRIYNMR